VTAKNAKAHAVRASGREARLKRALAERRASDVPAFTLGRLDSFTQGWTPTDVRELVAAYRAMAASRGRALGKAFAWQASDDATRREMGIELEIALLGETSE
jgi:hypothetical protein